MLSDYTVESHKKWIHENVLVDVQPKKREKGEERKRNLSYAEGSGMSFTHPVTTCREIM